MKQKPVLRYGVIAVLLFLGLLWSLASAQESGTAGYPESAFLADSSWLMQHLEDENLIIVDVRDDKHFDNRLIPGAVRLPWSSFRYDDTIRDRGGMFVGLQRSQDILGAHGISRDKTVLLYDSVAYDGGATASYVFWVLDLLGHKDMKILDRGIDGWVDAGGKTAAEPARVEPVLYQALSEEVKLDRQASAIYIYNRLDDRYFQILDVRSRDEYLGETPDSNLNGKALKLGHIPTAFNIPYQDNWVDPKTKSVKSYAQLSRMYAGLDPGRAVITYCHSARRGSYGYFILRLMGFSDVRLYDGSWFEWGAHNTYFPIETRENRLSGAEPRVSSGRMPSGGRATPEKASGGEASGSSSGGGKSGYISCGG